jgi:hypothetical protein
MRAAYRDVISWRSLLSAAMDFTRRVQKGVSDEDQDSLLRRALVEPPADVFAEFGHTTQQFGRMFLVVARPMVATPMTAGSTPETVRYAFATAMHEVAQALDLVLERHLLSLSARGPGGEEE